MLLDPQTGAASPLSSDLSALGATKPPPPAARLTPDLKFLAAVALRFEAPSLIGETPDGVRWDFQLHGSVDGPAFNGHFAPSAAYLLVDPDGVGLISARGPLHLNDGAVMELEATGRCDFGEDGYRRAAAGDLSTAPLGWCPRFLTGHSRYLWLNRVQCLGAGQFWPRHGRVDYDLFVVTSRSA